MVGDVTVIAEHLLSESSHVKHWRYRNERDTRAALEGLVGKMA